MIKVYNYDDIVYHLGALITYGLNEGYSYKSIEEHLVSSSFINALENGEYDIEKTVDEVVESTYKIKLSKEFEMSFMGLFFAESYFQLFLNLNRSFEYLFLYWPISDFVEKYGIYHEMDYSNLERDFKKYVKQTSLLRKLSITRQIKLSDVAKLTLINKNTIDKYSQDDKFLEGASINTTHKLSKLFGVKENLFVTNLGVYLDSSIYLHVKNNEDFKNYLGLYFANYFDTSINEKDFLYDKSSKLFISKNKDLKLVVLASEKCCLSINELNKKYDSHTYLIFFPGAYLDSNVDFNYLKNSPTLEVMVVTHDFIYLIKKGRKKEITDIIYKSLINLSKEKVSQI